ncbi:uncharacterized protein LOC131638600 [Vicia villosa]|nr:uncharacterized protein LOC131638600 [Vicia villosa]
MPELISRTRTRRSGGFVDERTKLYLEDYDRRLAIFLENNPQFMPAEGEPLNADVDHYIWCEVIKEKGPNGCFFGAGNLAASYRRGDRNLFQRLQDGEGGSRQPNLTQEQTELVRQLARRESEAQIEMMRKKQADMEEQHARQMEGIMKKQAEMEEQMRRFMQGGGNYSNAPPQEPEDDGVADDFNPDNYFPDDAS